MKNAAGMAGTAGTALVDADVDGDDMAVRDGAQHGILGRILGRIQELGKRGEGLAACRGRLGGFQREAIDQ